MLTKLQKMSIGSLILIGLTVTILQIFTFYTGGNVITTISSLTLIGVGLVITAFLMKSIDIKKYIEEMKQK